MLGTFSYRHRRNPFDLGVMTVSSRNGDREKQEQMCPETTHARHRKWWRA